jgi:hypothetical protein
MTVENGSAPPAQVDNGCMYVVPREFDAHHDCDAVYEHMVVQVR